MNVAAWLDALGLGEYQAAFRDHAIDAEVLPALTDEHLKELGLPLGDRLKLLRAIAVLNHPERDTGQPEAVMPSAAAGERRQVTVVFVDLAGYTELSNRLDAEELHGMLGRFFDLVDRIVEELDGWVEKHIGDSVMAVFGAPVAHGNDSERAILAALQARDAMKELSRESGYPVDVHAGVANGQVVAGDAGSAGSREYRVTGATVNLGSRLSAAAQGGQILVSDAVWRAVGDRFEGAEAGALPLKGFPEPVRAWQVLAYRGAGTEEAPPLIGRREEVAAFEQMVRTCTATKRGQALHLQGDAGIGKTRLVEEFRRLAMSAGFACHTGLVLDFGSGTGRDAVGLVLRGLLGVEATASSDAVMAAVNAAMAEGLATADDVPFLNDLLGVPQPSDLRAFYEALSSEARARGKRNALAGLVERASRRQPRLVVIEDVHWASDATLDYVAAISAAVGEYPVLVVTTSRADASPLDRLRGRSPKTGILVLEIRPLPDHEAVALARSAREAVLDQKTAEQCVAMAAGNPFFLREIVRHVCETKEIGVPSLIQSMVQARADRLDPIAKQALQAASVLGQRFDAAAMAHVLDQAGYQPDALVAAHLVRRVEQEFLFSHAIVRDAIYDTLLTNRRRELHRRAARWFDKRDAILCAEHLERAEDPEAPSAYLRAARQQTREYRYELALQLVDRGLAIAARQHDRFELMLFRGEALHDLGLVQECGGAYDSALAQAADDGERCRAWIGLATVKRIVDDLPGAFADLERAEAAATALGLVREQAQVHFIRGNLLFPRGDYDGCLREHSRSLALARQARAADVEVAALGGLGDAAYLGGRIVTAMANFQQCVDLAHQLGLGRIEVAHQPMAVACLRYIESGTQVREVARNAVASARRVGHARAEITGLWSCALGAANAGDVAEAMALSERALELSKKLRALRFEATTLALRGSLHRLSGHVSDALDDIGAALSIARTVGMSFDGALILGYLAEATEDPRVRKEALAEGEALLATGTPVHCHMEFGASSIEVSLRTGDWDRAVHYAALLEDYCRPEPVRWADYIVARGRALADWGRGRRDGALRAELIRLRAEGESLDQAITLAAIDVALAA